MASTFPRCLPHGVITMGLVRQIDLAFTEGHATGQNDPEAPVRTEPHPTFPRCLPHGVITMGLVRQIDQAFTGVTPQVRMSRKPRFGRSLTLPSRAASPRHHHYGVSSTNRPSIHGGHATGQNDPEAPVGRSLTYLPALPPPRHHHYRVSSTNRPSIRGGHATGQNEPASPGSDGASPLPT
jgi:hypothetical protein